MDSLGAGGKHLRNGNRTGAEIDALACRGEPRRGRSRWATLHDGITRLPPRIHDGDEEMVESAVIAFSQSRRMFAPLAFVVGAFIMLFDGLKLLVTNWRLTVVQILPAMWIWLATADLKAHVLHGRGFHHLNGAVLVGRDGSRDRDHGRELLSQRRFRFAIAAPPPPVIRPAFAASGPPRFVLGSGAVVGIALAISTLVLSRWGTRWFGLATGITIGIMTLCYVAVPGRLLGIKTATELLAARQAGRERDGWHHRRRDLHAPVCARPGRGADARLIAAFDPGPDPADVRRHRAGRRDRRRQSAQDERQDRRGSTARIR